MRTTFKSKVGLRKQEFPNELQYVPTNYLSPSASFLDIGFTVYKFMIVVGLVSNIEILHVCKDT